MPRPYKCRYVSGFPGPAGFKPAGVPGRNIKIVELGLDELEAIRLADLEGLYQEQAAEKMGVSRATFGRVLDQAHQKVADAIVNGKMLTFKGGHVSLPTTRTFICGSCGAEFQVPFGGGRPEECPRCLSSDIRRGSEGFEGPSGGGMGPGRRCRRRYRGGQGAGW